MGQMEALSSPIPSEKEIQPEIHAGSGQDSRTGMTSDQCVEPSPLHPDPEDTPLICSSPPFQDTQMSSPTSFSPPQMDPPAPEGSVPQPPMEPPVQYQVPHQLQVSQGLFAQNPVQIQPPVSQPPPQVQASAPQLQPSVGAQLHTSPAPLQISVSVPQQQPDPTAAGVSTDGGDSAVHQHTQNSETKLSPSPFAS